MLTDRVLPMGGSPELAQRPSAWQRVQSAVSSFGGWESALLALLVLQIVLFSQGSRGFFNGGEGALSQLQQFSGIGIAAIGLGLVVLTGGIDLSIGSVASLTGVMMAQFWSAGVPIYGAAVLALVVAAAIGAINGLIVTYGALDPLIVTLATMFVVSSVAVVVGNPKPYLFPDSFLEIGIGSIAGIPISDLLFFLLALIAGYVVGFTPFGRKLIMIGSNKAAAQYAGIRTRRVLIVNYSLSGLFAGLAGVVMSSLYASARADLAEQLLLPALTAVVLGGVDIFGGSGHIRGIVLGALTIGFLQQGLMLYGVNAVEVQLITGLLLAIAVAAKNLLSGHSLRDLFGYLRVRDSRFSTGGPAKE
jgi:AI-2 transport system permease protein